MREFSQLPPSHTRKSLAAAALFGRPRKEEAKLQRRSAEGGPPAAPSKEHPPGQWLRALLTGSSQACLQPAGKELGRGWYSEKARGIREL